MSEENPCKVCDGSGKLIIDAFTHKTCVCLYNRKMRTHLGSEIATATPVKNSPLFQEVEGLHGQMVLKDLTKKSLFIKSWWDELRGHLKWALYCKGPTFFFQVVTDERIRSVFVGNEQYSHRSRKVRDDVEANNSLRDLVGETYNLVIIRLGFLGYKNQAMAGALLEALRIRESLVLPTWIIEEPRSIFAPGHLSYGEELADYIHHNFPTLDLVEDKSRKEPPRGVEGAAFVDDGDMGMSLEDERTQRVATFQEDTDKRDAEKAPMTRKVAREIRQTDGDRHPKSVDAGHGPLGESDPYKKKWKKSGGSGGPV